MIDSLIVNSVMVSDHHLVMSHVVDFVSSLLSAKPKVGFRLANYFWASQDKVTSAENKALLIPLSEDEIFDPIRSANSSAASGRDDFSIPFFRQFWPQLRALVQAIIQGFWLGTVDISRLNYVVLTLIPKVKGADLITQFRSIALINNIAKLHTLSPFQSAFVKGRFILDGILCFMR